MLECVVNVSEGRDAARLAALTLAGGASVLDVHADPDHNRAVFTLCSSDARLDADVRALARCAVDLLDLRCHQGVHPRIGVLDVVPWIDLDHPWTPCTDRSLAARDRFAGWAARELELPCFRYGPGCTLPEVRRRAARGLAADDGPVRPHPTAGACAVGARGVLVAFNLWVAADADGARRVAAAIRRPGLRTLGLAVGTRCQVSCNLVDPSRLGPALVYDLVAAELEVTGAELVGLVPAAVLGAIAPSRWPELDLSPERTIEARLAGRTRSAAGG